MVTLLYVHIVMEDFKMFLIVPLSFLPLPVELCHTGVRVGLRPQRSSVQFPAATHQQ